MLGAASCPPVCLATLPEVAEIDFPRADLLIVLGTSLVVNPFASLIG